MTRREGSSVWRALVTVVSLAALFTAECHALAGDGNCSPQRHSGTETVLDDIISYVTHWRYGECTCATGGPCARCALFSTGRNPTLTVTDALGHTTTNTYDAAGNQTSVTDPLGNKSTFTYDGRGNQLTSSDPLGNVTTNTYDAKGNLLTTQNALGQTTTNVYDGAWNLTQTKDALGRVTGTFGYDRSGNMASTTDPSGVVRFFAYDRDGRQTGTSCTWQDPNDPQAPPRPVTTQTLYNAAGQVVKTVNPDGKESTTVYNELGKPAQTTDILGNSTFTVYDKRGNVIETRYPGV
jgi:YD repeat-containing protein